MHTYGAPRIHTRVSANVEQKQGRHVAQFKTCAQLSTKPTGDVRARGSGSNSWRGGADAGAGASVEVAGRLRGSDDVTAAGTLGAAGEAEGCFCCGGF